MNISTCKVVCQMCHFEKRLRNPAEMLKQTERSSLLEMEIFKCVQLTNYLNAVVMQFSNVVLH